MKKKLALLLAVALVFTCMLGLSATAETPSDEIAMVTVPMRATVSILYAVEAAGYNDPANVSVVIIAKGGETVEDTAENLGVYNIDGKDYILFEYSNLSAADMRTTVTAKVAGGTKTVEYSVEKFATDYEAANPDKTAEITLLNKMLAYGDAVAAMNN